jgi:hypothetical protein
MDARYCPRKKHVVHVVGRPSRGGLVMTTSANHRMVSAAVDYCGLTRLIVGGGGHCHWRPSNLNVGKTCPLRPIGIDAPNCREYSHFLWPT